MKTPALLIALALLTAAPADAATKRDHKAVAAFKLAHPCPATDRVRGPCPGHVVDHVVPLCAGGADHQSNMQWQTVEEAKIKDRAERAQCRRR